MPNSPFEILACIAILGFMVFVVFKGGTNNPVGTGQLQRQLNAIGAEVKAIKETIGTSCSTADLAAVRQEMVQIEKRTASSAEVIALEGKVNVIGERVRGWGEASRRTEQIVQRIEGHFLKRGIDRD